MRFYTVEQAGRCLPALSADGGKTAFLFADLGIEAEDLAGFIRRHGADGLPDAAEALRKADPGKAFPVQAARLCAPIMHPDQDVICLGINYDEHAVEAGRFSQEDFGGERPDTIYFSKRVSCATGDGDPIPAYPHLVEGLDYEVELGVILGRDVRGAAAETTEESIFGYTIINDVSARNLQTRHKQWYLGKSLDGFTPMGPCIVTPDELGDAACLDICCTVNGELRQHSNTRYMIQSTAKAIAELSAGMTLRAGTILATGTPAGVGMGFDPPRFLRPGDTVCCRIEGIGTLTNTVR
ncbi:MAG: fumarylacetoacetate hydrolase family protein [Clostridia bacterium]|nr:fumarylacetoacetate hydrolase family protein [Clostridia bacterium]